MSIGVPQSSAQAGEGTVYFQVQSVADSYSWVAIGTGTIMSDSNIFVFYPDGTGNVTVSTRRGTGHTLPPPQRDTRFELLAGSGIENGVMTANVACFNCESWDGGDMDLTGRSTAWIAAWKEGSPLNTQSVDTRIAQHDGRDQFRFDLTQATITEDTNPFVNGDTNEDEGDNGNNGNNGDTGNDGSIGSGNTDGASTAESSVDTLLMHGIIMTVTFTFLYPLGSMLIPLAGKWYIHAGCQVVAFLTMWAGFASGYITARTAGKVSLFPLPYSPYRSLTPSSSSVTLTPSSAPSLSPPWSSNLSSASCTTATTSSTTRAPQSPTSISGTAAFCSSWVS